MRYLVTTSFFINAKSDEDALYKAKYIAARQHQAKSDHCEILSVDEFDENTIRLVYNKDEVLPTNSQREP